MCALIEQLNQIRNGLRAAECEYKLALDEEVAALDAYDKAHAESMLVSEQRTEGLRQAETTLAVEMQLHRKRLAIGLRRSASEAGKNLRQQLKTLEAAFHAYNAEMKTELSLAGSLT